MSLRDRFEVLEGEQLKTAAEWGLHHTVRLPGPLQEAAFTMLRGSRVEDPRLGVEVAGIDFENPIMVGAGWDKKGRAVDGLHALGFAGTEVGTVLVHPQAGNPKPRLWYREGAGLNRLGFNSPGQEEVAAHLAQQERRGVVGVSLGLNKLATHDQAPWAHATVAERLDEFADYLVVNVASPNTPGLREMLKKDGPMAEIVTAVKEAAPNTPLFIKTTVDLELEDLDAILAVCADQGTGIIDTNTTMNENIKSLYGWVGEAGGLSGSDVFFRRSADDRMRHIYRETRGTDIERIGVGAISDGRSAIWRLAAGAQVLQVVTGIRQRGPRVASAINREILEIMDRDGVSHVSEYIGQAA